MTNDNLKVGDRVVAGANAHRAPADHVRTVTAIIPDSDRHNGCGPLVQLDRPFDSFDQWYAADLTRVTDARELHEDYPGQYITGPETDDDGGAR